MSQPISSVALRCCQFQVRSSSRSATNTASSPLLRSVSFLTYTRQRRRRCPHSQRRWQSTEAVAVNPKIDGIVDQISRLTLLETADLVASLKARLNIPDLSFAAPSSSSASAPAAAAAEPEEAAPAVQEKTLFTLKLQSFEPTAKPKIIKEVKSMLGLSLVDSKKFVESAPKVLKEQVSKEEGQKILETLKALGGVVVME